VAYTTDMQLNKLGYDRDRRVVEFSMRRSFDETAIVITGEVPMMVIDSSGLRTAAKAAVRQALLDAADALTDKAAALEVHEGIRPEDLNAANDD
jgi:hypothetical protein